MNFTLIIVCMYLYMGFHWVDSPTLYFDKKPWSFFIANILLWPYYTSKEFIFYLKVKREKNMIKKYSEGQDEPASSL